MIDLCNELTLDFSDRFWCTTCGFEEIFPETSIKPVKTEVAAVSQVSEPAITAQNESEQTRNADTVAETQSEPVLATTSTAENKAENKVENNTDEAEQALEAVESESITEQVDKVEAKSAIHTVKSGDNLYNISVRYNIKQNALRKWNDISDNNNIRIGDKLYVVDPTTVKND